MHMDFERKCIMSERLTKVLKMSEKYSRLRQIWTSSNLDFMYGNKYICFRNLVFENYKIKM